MYLTAVQQAVAERHPQVASIFFIALAAVSSVAAEGCYKGGQAGSCDDAAYLFCKEMLTINGGQTDTESNSVTKSSTRTITESDCAGAMFINGNCDNGGNKTINGIEYTADPNEGVC
ncbi:hypothetical protein ARMGADRAFT_1032050 [Armillaria gallica]|uniref:Uncharacterized protein n=1 Tax=Armillaria gallica TaxID=47427 RepID=A0A2H3D6T9_ARMGA|nr:hypothetical protein ARMGADRAFT_1032050 [Armillaria gallica]